MSNAEDISFLHYYINQKPCSRMIDMMATLSSSLIPCSKRSNLDIPSIAVFITQLVLNARIKTRTLLVSLVYLKKIKESLPPTAQGMHCTCHRIMIACLIISDKYLFDSPLKNKSWAAYSGYFNVSEINLMERQLLSLLNYNIQIQDAELANVVHACYLNSFNSPVKTIHDDKKRCRSTRIQYSYNHDSDGSNAQKKLSLTQKT